MRDVFLHICLVRHFLKTVRELGFIHTWILTKLSAEEYNHDISGKWSILTLHLASIPNNLLSPSKGYRC